MKAPTSSSRVRTSFDPELELPRLHRWFAENPHPSRLTLQLYVSELNSLASRQSRKLLEVHNLCYWFKNARAAYKRAELRLKKGHHNGQRNLHDGDDAVQDQGDSINKSDQFSNGTHKVVVNSNRATLSKSMSPKSAIQFANRKLHHSRSSNQLMTSTDESMINSEAESSSSDSQLAHRGHKLNSMNGANSRSYADLGYLDRSNNSSDNYFGTSARAASTSPTSLARSSTSSALFDIRQPPATSTINNVDLASAVNCLLSTASNFTVAAAAAAAAAAASTSINPPTNLLQAPSGAINLAGIINAGQQIVSPAGLAAAIANPNVIANPAAALVEQPLRQLFTSFNPSTYQLALGMLDNKMMDSNILNAMAFPTSACAPEPRHGLPNRSSGYHLTSPMTNNYQHHNLIQHRRARFEGNCNVDNAI